MVLELKSQQQRTIDRGKRLSQWHRKWAWWPTRIDEREGTSIWVWMRWYFRRMDTRMEYLMRRRRRHYYLDITRTCYALDEFDLLVKTREQQEQEAKLKERYKFTW